MYEVVLSTWYMQKKKLHGMTVHIVTLSLTADNGHVTLLILQFTASGGRTPETDTFEMCFCSFLANFSQGAAAPAIPILTVAFIYSTAGGHDGAKRKKNKQMLLMQST